MKSLRLIVYGHVQRVGYRDAVAEVARKLGVKGTVRNMEDEVSVEIIAEGDEKQLHEFVKLVNIHGHAIAVEKIEAHEEKATGEFKHFRILRGDGFAEVGERMDVAGSLLYKMLDKQDQMLGKQDQMLDKQDQMLGKQDQMLDRQDKTIEKLDTMHNSLHNDLKTGFDQLGNKIDKFSDATQQRFDHLDVKYGKVSEKLERISDSLEKLVNILEAFKPR